MDQVSVKWHWIFSTSAWKRWHIFGVIACRIGHALFVSSNKFWDIGHRCFNKSHKAFDRGSK